MNIGSIIANLRCIDDEYTLYSFERTAINEACAILERMGLQRETRGVLENEKIQNQKR